MANPFMGAGIAQGLSQGLLSYLAAKRDREETTRQRQREDLDMKRQMEQDDYLRKQRGFQTQQMEDEPYLQAIQIYNQTDPRSLTPEGRAQYESLPQKIATERPKLAGLLINKNPDWQPPLTQKEILSILPQMAHYVGSEGTRQILKGTGVQVPGLTGPAASQSQNQPALPQRQPPGLLGRIVSRMPEGGSFIPRGISGEDQVSIPGAGEKIAASGSGDWRTPAEVAAEQKAVKANRDVQERNYKDGLDRIKSGEFHNWPNDQKQWFLSQLSDIQEELSGQPWPSMKDAQGNQVFVEPQKPIPFGQVAQIASGRQSAVDAGAPPQTLGIFDALLAQATKGVPVMPNEMMGGGVEVVPIQGPGAGGRMPVMNIPGGGGGANGLPPMPINLPAGAIAQAAGGPSTKASLGLRGQEQDITQKGTRFDWEAADRSAAVRGKELENASKETALNIDIQNQIAKLEKDREALWFRATKLANGKVVDARIGNNYRELREKSPDRYQKVLTMDKRIKALNAKLPADQRAVTEAPKAAPTPSPKIDEKGVADDLRVFKGAGKNGSYAASSVRNYLKSKGMSGRALETETKRLMNLYFWKKG
jgi:hypothetical protein